MSSVARALALGLAKARGLLIRRGSVRAAPVLLLALWAVTSVLMATCGAPAAGATIQTSLSRSTVATSAAREKMRREHADAVASVAHVTVTPDSLSRMMEQDLANNQPYIAWLRSSQGDAAATRLEDAIRGPYQRRIDQMRALGVDHQDFDIPVVTVWGSLTFSMRSYDVNFGAMDPVSMLFTGNGTPDSVYQDLTSADPCATDAQCRPPAFQDDKGSGAQARGFGCQSQTQWVLMGDAGAALDWRPSSRGVMGGSDKCTQGVREHMRIFGGASSPVFGRWSVATPHKETWSDGSSGRVGHLIQSWNEARNDFAAFWQGFAKRPGAAGAVQALNWGNGGLYQNVEFDGRGTVVELCPCP